ncbi:MAG: transposase, partial [Gemmataceae bacterium]
GYKNVTSICGLRLSGVVAAMAFEGGTDQCAFRTFVQECLVPGIQKGDVIIWDNLRVYQDTQFIEWIEQAGARVMPLPPYSPDFNPIEEMFSKIKAILRKLAQRTTGTLYEGFAQALQCVTLNSIFGWCQHRGLCSTQA